MELERRKATFKGPADWFTGDVYVDPLAQGQGPSPVSLGWVHFTPCAHTAWHRHSFGQTLCVTEGEGFVQARNGPLIRIRAGDVIVTPPGEWHWHGAAPNHFMAHLAVTEGETEWGEHLSADEYPSEQKLANRVDTRVTADRPRSDAGSPIELSFAVIRQALHDAEHHLLDNPPRHRPPAAPPLTNRPYGRLSSSTVGDVWF